MSECEAADAAAITTINEVASIRRREVAEYVVLDRFDLERGLLGHDYGNGQRASELGRRSIELGYSGVGIRQREELAGELELEELRTAFDRIVTPRVERAEAGHNRPENIERIKVAGARTADALGLELDDTRIYSGGSR